MVECPQTCIYLLRLLDLIPPSLDFFNIIQFVILIVIPPPPPGPQKKEEKEKLVDDGLLYLTNINRTPLKFHNHPYIGI